MTVEAMECRDLLHAWPRPKDPAHQALIKFEVIARVGGRPSAIRREMTCTAGCGVVKVQRYRVTRDGRMQREGHTVYRYPEKGYRLPKPEDGARIEPMDRDALRYSLLSRLYPDLAW